MSLQQFPPNQPYSPPQTFQRERSVGAWFRAGFGVTLGIIAASLIPWALLILIAVALISNANAGTY